MTGVQRPPARSARYVTALQWLVHLGAAAPLIWLVLAVLAGDLGGDPTEAMMRFLGKGAIHLLLLTLAVSPLAKALRAGRLIRLRRPLGLWCFAWATLHFAVWLGLDVQFHWALIAGEIAQRQFLLVGFLAWIILLALAATSVPRVMRVMGSRWKKLHRLVYVVALLAPVHYLWAVKSGWWEPAIYLGIAALLLVVRRDWIERSLLLRRMAG